MLRRALSSPTPPIARSNHNLRTLALALVVVSVASCGGHDPKTLPPGAPPLVKTADDQSIGPDGQVVDVYVPAEPNGKLLVWVHGGAWVGGSEEDINGEAGLAARYLSTKDGWTVLSVRYRLADANVHLAEQVTDVHAAIAWGRANAAELKIDPTKVYSMGFSAGGHLAVMAALTSGVAALEPTWATGDSSVTATVSMAGAFCLDQNPVTPTCGDVTPQVLGCQVGACDPQVIAAAQPQTWVNDNIRNAATPRLRFIAGDKDIVVDSNHTRMVANQLADLLGKDRVQFELVKHGPAANRGHVTDAALDIDALVKFLG